MATLLLRLSAPMQSWGAESLFDTRRTEKAPTKSGVLGMIANAMGRDRDDSMDDLAAMKFGVRIDEPGVVIDDFQVARREGKKSNISHRYYLSDAVFVAALETDDADLLKKVEEALKAPKRHLYLGRKGCPLTLPLCLGVRESSLLETLSVEKLQTRKKRSASRNVEILYETDEGTNLVKDVPLSYRVTKREYGYRRIKTKVLAFTGEE